VLSAPVLTGRLAGWAMPEQLASARNAESGMDDGLPSEEAAERQEHFKEAFGRFFDLPVMILFGAVIPWQGWADLGWHGAVFAVGIFLLRRPPVWLLLGRFMPWAGPPRALFGGWFGPIGGAALFCAVEIQGRMGLHTVWPVVSLAGSVRPCWRMGSRARCSPACSATGGAVPSRWRPASSGRPRLYFDTSDPHYISAPSAGAVP